MSEFTIRSESVDVEQIMKQIRQRILEKRGQDYTEDQIRELASVRLEKFLDPKNLRSDLLDQFRKSRPALVPVADEPPPPVITPPYAFDDQTLFTSHRGLMRLIRRLMNPLLKLMFNPNTLNQILHSQAQFNVDTLKRVARQGIEQRHLLRQMEHSIARSRNEWNALYYEVLHNMVLETTRMGIEVQNQRMKIESLSSRLDFSERRVRALEGVVQYRPEVVRGHDRDEDRGAQSAQGAQAAQSAAAGSTGGFEGFVPASGQQGQGQGQGDGSGRRRRRRRRGRRGGQSQGAEGASGASGAFGAGASGAQGPQGDLGNADDGFDDNEGDEGEESEPMDAGAEAQEALDAISRAIEAPQAPAEPDAPEAPQAPEAPKAPGSDDVQ